MKGRKVREYYNAFSQDYDSRYQAIQFDKYNIVFSDEFSLTEWIIDHGGGTGILSEWLNYPLLTVDISIEMMRVGKKRGKNFQGLAADMNKMPIRKNSIHTILSFTALQNSSDISNSLDEIIRIWEKKGKLILTFLQKGFPRELFIKWVERNEIKLAITNNVVEDIVFQSII